MQRVRLQKILSQVGLGSRREMEQWIEKGWVSVNGMPAKLGDSAGPKDKISVKGKLIAQPTVEEGQLPRILLYHKPVGEISSRRDPHHTKTVFDTLPKLKSGRWIQVGRLDLNTSGLLLFTNEGELANQLMHPKTEVEREYAVRVYGEVSDQAIRNLLKGVPLEEGVARFKSIKYQGGEGTNGWYHVILTEGKNREVRRLWKTQGVEVSRLIRIRYGKLSMPRSLARGQWCELSRAEVAQFMRSLTK